MGGKINHQGTKAQSFSNPDRDLDRPLNKGQAGSKVDQMIIASSHFHMLLADSDAWRAMAIQIGLILGLGGVFCLATFILAFIPATKRLAFHMGCYVFAIGLILLALLLKKGTADPLEMAILTTPALIGGFVILFTWRFRRKSGK